MKYLLIPLLIIGMFVSFTAALLAMLFFTETVKSPQELQQIILGEVDSTRLSDEFIDPEDKLGQLFALAEDYRTLYESERDRNEVILDSLARAEAQQVARRDSLDLIQVQLGAQQDSERLRALTEGVESLATFYNKMKPVPAAEILQEGTLGDTTVAMVMRKLAPQHMAKVMSNMNADFAARVSKLIQELPDVR